ncbi:MAG: hypothetical protein JWO06_1709 [Bacteroidota bacterium]|nr:hypothetical protein [Bacteroidota bacterium]
MFKWLEKYFTFSRGERNAVITLIVLCFVVLLVPKVYLWLRPVQHIDNPKAAATFVTDIAATAQTPESDSIPVITLDLNAAKDSAAPVKRKELKTGKYFDFDPNKIGVDEWVRLGFSEKQAEVIEHYKARGGKFYRPEDLMRLYVMTEEHYNKLQPYVKIDAEALPKRNYKKY